MGDTSPVSPTKLRPCNQSSLWSRLQTTLAQIARIAPKWIYTVLKFFSPFTIFEQLALALKKQSCPELFLLYGIYFLYSEFLSNLHALALKNRVALIFFTVFEHVFFIIQDFWATSACPEKKSCPEIFCCMEYTFYILNFWATSACPEKPICPEIFRCMEYAFYIQNFWTTCGCPEKQRVPWIHYIECIFYHSEFLSNLHLPWKTESALKFFAVLNIFFIILEFWGTCACPENRVTLEFSLYWIYFLHSEFLGNLHALALKNRGCPEFIVLNVYFFYSGFLSNLHSHWKTELPWNFSLYWNIFYDSGFLRNLLLPWKTDLPWKFSSLGGRPPPQPPASYAYEYNQ